MSDLIRATSLFGYPQLVAELGGDPNALLRSAGIDPDVVGEHHRFIPYTALAMAVGSAAEVVQKPEFPLLLARRQGITILGPIAVVMRHSETFGDALDGASRYLHTYSPAVAVTVRRGLHPRLDFSIGLRRMSYRAQMVELSLGITVEVFRLLIGDDFVPPRVDIRHRPLGPGSMYEPLLGPGVCFEQDVDAVHLPPGALQQRLDGIDSRAKAIAEEYLSPIRADVAIADHAQQLIERMLPLGQASLNDVARVMSVHPRALQRELAATGVTFEQLLDECRRSIAWTLAATQTSGSQVAAILGYREQSSYTRACRRWFALSPRELSRQRRGNPDAAYPVA